ncbi:unnamed protein product [Withania somnifera]
MIVVGCLPFTFASSEAFVLYIQRIYNPMFLGIPRSTCKLDVFRLHAQYAYYLRTLFINIPCRVSLTSDLGRLVNRNDYLTITCHWIDNNFLIQKRILAFIYDENRRHDAEFINETITKVVNYYNLNGKVLSIAFDNASNNTAAIEMLKINLSPPLIDVFHVRCACHVYNLIVKDGLAFFELVLEKLRLVVGFIQGNNRKIRLKEFKTKCAQFNLRPRLMPEEIDTSYPVLSALARDVMNIPMSTVASESAFGQGRQQIGDHRHSLGSNAMNVLICLRDWIGREIRTKGLVPDEEEEEEIEELLSTQTSEEASPSPRYGYVDFDDINPVDPTVNIDELNKMIEDMC